MKRRRRTKRTYTPTFKASVVARVLRGRGNRSETQRAIADDLRITETRISEWVRQAKKKGVARARGQTEALPTLEIRGLRAWVNHAVRLEIDRIFGKDFKP